MEILIPLFVMCAFCGYFVSIYRDAIRENHRVLTIISVGGLIFSLCGVVAFTASRIRAEIAKESKSAVTSPEVPQ